MEVKVISSETIKPSSPTPSSLRKFTLSLLDQKYTPLVVPAIQFYERPQGATPIDINRLKTCLSQTLSVFYPLAGRVESASTILCNDEGIPFVEAHVNCTLSSVVESVSSAGDVDLKPFYPPRDRLLVDGIQFAIQINVFSCGGFAFAWYCTHKVTDGTSTSYFFRYWAELVAQRREYAAQDLADFSSAVKTFPPVPIEEKPVTPEVTPVKQEGQKQQEDEEKGGSKYSFLFKRHIVARSFVISNEAVAKLKAMSISEEVTNPSRFEVVAGFLWKSILANSTTKEGRSMLSLPVDLRSRVDPPLPVESIGNLFDTTLVVSEKNVELHELVAKIRASISKMKDLATEYQGEKREEAKDGQWGRFISAVIECKGKDAYVITPWYKSAGFTKLDFGFGKPKRVIPIDDIVNHKQMNTIILMESNDSDGEGFEAWTFLEEECMKFLESNPDFLAFASPNF